MLPARWLGLDPDVGFEGVQGGVRDRGLGPGGLKNQAGGANDTLTGGAEDVGQVVLVVDGLQRPTGDVVERVLA